MLMYLVRMSLFCFQQCSRLLIILNCWLILGTNAEVDISLRTAQYNAKMEEIVCNAETNISSRIAILSKISLKYTFYEAGNLTSKSVGRESPFRRKQQMGGQFLKSDLDRYGCEAENWYYGACIVSETLERNQRVFAYCEFIVTSTDNVTENASASKEFCHSCEPTVVTQTSIWPWGNELTPVPPFATIKPRPLRRLPFSSSPTRQLAPSEVPTPKEWEYWNWLGKSHAFAPFVNYYQSFYCIPWL